MYVASAGGKKAGIPFFNLFILFYLFNFSLLIGANFKLSVVLNETDFNVI